MTRAKTDEVVVGSDGNSLVPPSAMNSIDTTPRKAITLTEEGVAIVNSTKRLKRVTAFAGCGKTTNIVAYCQARPNSKILYTVYNKAAADDAKKKMPSNVRVMTQDALAYQFIFPKYKGTDKELRTVYARDVIRAEAVDNKTAKLIIDVVGAYFISADRDLSGKHFRSALEIGGHISDSNLDPLMMFTDAQVMRVLKSAQRVIIRICDPTDKQFPITFAAMMKQFQLAEPILSGIDELIVDEAQDTNEVFSSIVHHNRLNNPALNILIVGDRHQTIYQYRGAKDFLSVFEADEDFPLSRSYRFGRGIALLSTFLLRQFKGEQLDLVGAGEQEITGWDVDQSKPYAIVSRTNASLFEEAVSAIENNKAIHLLGGLAKYRFEPIMDAYNLWARNKVRIVSPEIQAYKTWDDLKRYVEESKDASIRVICKLVEQHQHKIPDLLKSLTEKNVDDRNKADVILSTGHSCKGDEFDQVILTDDYPSLLEGRDGQPPSDQDINLTYVAITRAKKAIYIPPKMRSELKQLGCSLEAINLLQKNNLRLTDLGRLPKRLPPLDCDQDKLPSIDLSDLSSEPRLKPISDQAPPPPSLADAVNQGEEELDDETLDELDKAIHSAIFG